MRTAIALSLFLSLVAHADSTVKPPPAETANREVLDVIEKYRRAMEARDPAALIALAHPRYHEDSGTPSPDDDYDYAGLKAVLTTRLSKVRGVKLKLTYRKVVIEGARAHVDVQQDGSFLLGDKWVSSQQSNRIELEREGTRWLITRGM